MATPIWRDTYVTKAAVSSLQFQIRTSAGVTIYQGTAYSKTSGGGVTIKVNDICADYLRNQLPAMSDIQYSEAGEVRAQFTIYDLDAQATLSTVEFSLDWSYDRAYDNTGVFSSAPIRRTFVQGQTLFIGYNNAPATITGTITLANGSSVAISLPRAASADFNGDFNSDFFITPVSMIAVGTLAINLNNYPTAVAVNIGAMTWTLERGCQRYALHYINAYGGWDSIWMSSGVITDSYKRNTIQRLINNTTASARGTVNFANTYTQKYQLHTGWLLNAEGEKMHHLLGSTCVFLQDIVKSEIIAVNITDTSCEYKSYRSQGGRLVDFTINCEVAQERKRQ